MKFVHMRRLDNMTDLPRFSYVCFYDLNFSGARRDSITWSIGTDPEDIVEL